MDFESAFYNTDDYEITGDKLGNGSYGTVFIAKKRETQEKYAIKIIHPNFDSEDYGHDQMLLMRESLILHKTDHPAVVKFYGINFQSHDDPSKFEPSIVTEYVPNGSLDNILKKEHKSIKNPKWNSTKKCISILGICEAMRYLHSLGIIHRDLKPGNVLMDENYYPHICDFGMSRCFPESFSKSISVVMTKNIGTPFYMAPELFDGNDNYGSSVDVYAFSILAYEIVTNKVPYSDLKFKNFIVFYNKVLSGARPKFTSDINPKMKQLISKCWDIDPMNRPTFQAIFDLLSNDLSYFDGDIDQEEVNNYINLLKEARKKEEETNYKIEFNESFRKNSSELQESIKEDTSKPQEKAIEDETEHHHKDLCNILKIENNCLLNIIYAYTENSKNQIGTKVLDEMIIPLACKSGNIELFKYFMLLYNIDLKHVNDVFISIKFK